MQFFLLSYDQQCPGIKRRWLIVAGLEILFASLAFHPTRKMKGLNQALQLFCLVQLPLWGMGREDVQFF